MECTIKNLILACSLSLVFLATATNAQNQSSANFDDKNASSISPKTSIIELETRSGASVDDAKPLTRDDAIQLALKQASTFQQSQINEQIAAQDIVQAKSAFYPRIAANPALIYTTPSLGNFNPSTQTSRPPSYLGANAVAEYQGLFVATGEIDFSGRLRTALRRSRELLEVARFGTEVERRNLVFAVSDAYFNLELSTAKRRNAIENLRTAEDFENNVKLNLDAGEVAPVELTRAKLQTTTRRDELEQTKTVESAAADVLRVFVGYSFTDSIATTDLLTEIPQIGEIENLAQTGIASRPELSAFDAQIRASQAELETAKRERKPQLTYNVNTGFISDSLNPTSIKNSVGFQANIGVSFPLFDKGASKSREAQAILRSQSLQNQRIQTERTFAQAFFTARTQGLSAITRIKFAADGIELAKFNLTASLARYRAGEAQIIEVTDAQNTLVNQQNALYQAIFDYQSARLRLLQAIGK